MRTNSSNKILVIGVSLKADRYSNMAVHRLVMYNIPTVAIGLKKGIVAGVEIDTELNNYTDLHTVTLYLNPKRQQELYDYILSLKPQRVLFNPGTENVEFMNILDENNIAYEIACTLTLLATNQY